MMVYAFTAVTIITILALTIPRIRINITLPERRGISVDATSNLEITDYVEPFTMPSDTMPEYDEEELGEAYEFNADFILIIGRILGIIAGIIFVVAVFCIQFYYFGMQTWTTQLMVELQLPVDNALQLMMALNIGSIFGCTLIALPATKISPKILTMLCAATVALCLFGIAGGAFGDALLFALLVLTGAVCASSMSLVNAVTSTALPSYLLPAALGITVGCGRAGAMVAPATGGFVLAAWGPAAVMACFGLIAVICVLVMAMATKRRISRSVAGIQSGEQQIRN